MLVYLMPKRPLMGAACNGGGGREGEGPVLESGAMSVSPRVCPGPSSQLGPARLKYMTHARLVNTGLHVHGLTIIPRTRKGPKAEAQASRLSRPR
ncbi:hypothetical protein GEV33_005231 [Tenebrio molitor]|uniref:Uncharacterized protein n=1 Tax=Tenebrio molitor TaxID=7067 RepID=A0A8J6HMY0_TENMO|nr:hypothetical protein GEV33_005231 [Tenebrio molitor]